MKTIETPISGFLLKLNKEKNSDLSIDNITKKISGALEILSKSICGAKITDPLVNFEISVPGLDGLIEVHTGKWNAFEVLNQYRQVYVILEVLNIFSKSEKGLLVNNLSLSQDEGTDIILQQGHNEIFIEVYGGINVNNNGKFRDDIKNLFKEHPVETRLNKEFYFACFKTAWNKYAPKLIEGYKPFDVSNDSPICLKQMRKI